jgi:hypothetical protein
MAGAWFPPSSWSHSFAYVDHPVINLRGRLKQPVANFLAPLGNVDRSVQRVANLPMLSFFRRR